MNQFCTLQNEPAKIKLLAAQRELYLTAKRFLSIFFILVVPVPILFITISWLFPSCLALTNLASFVFVLTSYLYLIPEYQNRQRKAALIQEKFDCEVLGIDWNIYLSGQFPLVDDIDDYAKKYEKHKDPNKPLVDWYRVEVSKLPLEAAKLACQYSNIAWDEKLKKRFSGFLLFIMLAIPCAVTVIGILFSLTINRMILLFYPLILPLYIFGAPQWIGQKNASKSLSQMKSIFSILWAEAKNKTTDPNMLAIHTRQFQDRILLNRSLSPIVPEFLYNFFRKKSEESSQRTIKDLVREYKENESIK